MNAPVVLSRDAGKEPIAAFAGRASFEATRLEPGDLDALRAAFAPATPVYVSAIPSRPLAAQVETAVQIAAAGFEPVPHIAARCLPGPAALERHLRDLARSAGVRRVLVIGGDQPTPAGPFFAALDVIESGLLQARGIVEAGIAGYPQGHPRLGADALERAMAAKIEAASATGLKIHIVTQFCFSAPAILAFTERLQAGGVDVPVRVGLAGPTTLRGLLRFAGICGVPASARGLVRHTGLARQLFGMVTPDTVLRPLAEEAARHPATSPPALSPHIFPFGGLGAAARWAGAAAAGRFTLERDDGFTVAPP